jgi:hypothetical protein
VEPNRAWGTRGSNRVLGFHTWPVTNDFNDEGVLGQLAVGITGSRFDFLYLSSIDLLPGFHKTMDPQSFKLRACSSVKESFHHAV